MSKLLFLNSNFTTKAVADDDSSIYIEGYANTTDVDRSGDIILAAAWSHGMKNYLKNPIFLAYHDHDDPIGRLDDHKISEKGLWVRARISKAAGQVFDLIKDGVLTAFSVGFRILDAEYDSVLDLFVIKDLELMEISVVSVPCNQDSIFSLAKSFESQAECNEFKTKFSKQQILDNSQEAKPENPLIKNNKGIKKMDEKELAVLLAKAAEDGANAATARLQAEADAKAAKDASEKALEDKIAKAVATQISVGQSGAEKLLADVEKRLAEQADSTKSLLDGLQAEIKEKAAEIEAINKSKMKFGTKESEGPVSEKEKETAVFLKTIMGKANIADTVYGKSLVEKAGAHVPGAIPWELQVSLNMEAEIRQRLVVQSLLRQVAMQTNVMKIPLNPATGLGTWVTNAQFGTTASTGAAATHQLAEITLSAYKVATLEYLAYEEEEDSLLILLPVIRDAMVRRVARSVDVAFLRGAGAGADPVKGLATYATANTDVQVGTKVTVANLRTMRKNLGIFGLDPADVTYVVSSDVYYDLLDDTVFQTMNQVGNQATLLTGQIGQIGNSPVVVSGEFVAKAAGASGVNVGAICVATSNFIAGNQRGLRFDTQMLAETQRQALVASLRTGMTQLTSNQGQGVSKLAWIA